MKKTLRERFETARNEEEHIFTQGHHERFLVRLDEAFPKGKESMNHPFIPYWMAASVVIIATLIAVFYNNSTPVNEGAPAVVNIKDDQMESKISVGDLSPELKKIEDYYIGSIHLQLSKLNISKQNKQLVDSYMKRLAELDSEYKNLTKELNESGPKDRIIEALIENLQLRLSLLNHLQNQLQQYKTSKNEISIS